MVDEVGVRVIFVNYIIWWITFKGESNSDNRKSRIFLQRAESLEYIAHTYLRPYFLPKRSSNLEKSLGSIIEKEKARNMNNDLSSKISITD